MTARAIFLLGVAFLVAGCANTPPDWTVRMELGCGSSVERIEKVAGRQVLELKSPRGWRTHVIREKDAVVWLGFEDGKLRYYQPTWPVRGRMAQYSSLDICENRFFFG